MTLASNRLTFSNALREKYGLGLSFSYPPASPQEMKSFA